MKPPNDDNEEDTLTWTGSSDGNFTMAATYRSLSNYQTQAPEPIFEKIWRWDGPERVRIFLWKAGRGALLTNEQRFNRGMGQNPLCPRCGLHIESVENVLRSCNLAQEVWNNVGSGPLDQQF